ncbi:hypothetical protein Tco_0377042 [Tanacetum coccineum]
MPYPRFTKQYGLAIPATMLNNEIIQSESYKKFILYSTGQIPLKKSRGKGSQGKMSADPTEEYVDMSDKSEPEPLIRRKTSSRRVKKKATISVNDNIVPKPDIALELGKSTSLTEAKEEACNKTSSCHSCKNCLRIYPRTCEKKTAADIMKALKDSRRMLGRQPGTGGSDEGTGEILGVLDEINVRKNADTEMKDAEKTVEKEIFKQPPVLQQTTPIPTTITTPPINTEAPSITTTIPEITPFIALQLRVVKLEQDMFEVKKIDHSTTVLALIQFHVPPVVDKVKQESEKSPEEIIIIKREQEEKKQEPTYTIKSTDKAALE